MRLRSIAVFLLILISVGCQSSTETAEKWVFIQRVVDGDTAVLSTRERVRYIGIDTPELARENRAAEPYAYRAKQANREMVEGKKIRLEFDVERYDKYGRLLAYLFLEDGTFVNAELMAQGYAELLTIPPNVRYVERLRALEQEARKAKRGLWRAR